LKKEKSKKEEGTRPEAYDFRRHGATVSLLQKYLRCRYSAKLYLEGWSPMDTTSALFFGSLFHDTLHKVYEHFRVDGVPDDVRDMVRQGVKVAKPYLFTYHREAERIMSASEITALDADVWTVLALLRPYLRFWKKDFYERKWVGLETEFVASLGMGHPGEYRLLRGKRDGVFRDKRGKLRILETKTKSRLDNDSVMLNALSLDMQNLFYTVATWAEMDERPVGVSYNIVRRPQLRQKKKESSEAFSSRILGDIRKRPLFYFKRYELVYPKSDVVRFRDELIMLLKEFEAWLDGDRRFPTYKNRTSCIGRFNCPYLAHCGSDSFAGYQISPIFTELESF
jgi:hypothetical protein